MISIVQIWLMNVCCAVQKMTAPPLLADHGPCGHASSTDVPTRMTYPVSQSFQSLPLVSLIRRCTHFHSQYFHSCTRRSCRTPTVPRLYPDLGWVDGTNTLTCLIPECRPCSVTVKRTDGQSLLQMTSDPTSILCSSSRHFLAFAQPLRCCTVQGTEVLATW